MVQDLSPEEQQMYMQQMQENYQSPSNFGKLESYDLFAHVKNASCGDSFDLFIKLDGDDKISDISFSGEGCAISTASFSLLTQKIKGMKIDDAKKLSSDDIYKLIGLKISPGRVNCALLSLNALQESK